MIASHCSPIVVCIYICTVQYIETFLTPPNGAVKKNEEVLAQAKCSTIRRAAVSSPLVHDPASRVSSKVPQNETKQNEREGEVGGNVSTKSELVTKTTDT